MATEIVVEARNEPGVLARIGEALGEAGVNITALCAAAVSGQGVIRLVTSDAGAAETALKGAGLEVRGTSEAIELNLTDAPGALGGAARKLAGAGVNIDAAYTAPSGAGGTTVILAVDDPAKAKGVV